MEFQGYYFASSPTKPKNRTYHTCSDGGSVGCAVCGENASGVYFGALVCLPCKSFYIRCTKGSGARGHLTCLADRKCEINRNNRMRCQYCRYQKCIAVGMYRREKPETIEPGEGEELCRVCHDIANGVHFGVLTCEGCKKFFRRALKEASTYQCKYMEQCRLNPRNRNSCRYCRYQRCLAAGMSRTAIRMGRPKKVKDLSQALQTRSLPSCSSDSGIDGCSDTELLEACLQMQAMDEEEIWGVLALLQQDEHGTAAPDRRSTHEYTAEPWMSGNHQQHGYLPWAVDSHSVDSHQVMINQQATSHPGLGYPHVQAYIQYPVRQYWY